MAGTPFTTIYENLGSNATTVPGVSWKFDHEYIVYTIERNADDEVGVVYINTHAASLRAIDRGFLAVTVDAWIVLDRQTMQIKSESRKGDACPILKVLERPITVGVSDFTSENWEVYYSGPGVSQLNIDWPDDYEYVIFVHATEPPGKYPDLKWSICAHFFCPAAMNGSDINGGGYLKPIEGASGVMMFRGRFSSPTGRHIRKFDKGDGLIAYILRRKFRTDTKATTEFNSWKQHTFALPNGVQAGGNWRDAKPYAWPDDTEIMIVSQDPKGSTEMATSYYYTDTNIQNTTQINWRERGLLYDAGYDHFIELLKANWQNRGTKHIRSSDGRIYAAWEKLPTLDVPPPEPPPPVDPVIDCRACVPAGSLWEQTASIEVRFVKPDDWQLRNYRYEWHGDIGNGSVELIGTEANGRIAKIRFVKLLEPTDDGIMFPINVAVTVYDMDYAAAGIQDSDTAIIEFELPCIVVANQPDISIEDITVLEQDVNHVIQVTVSLSEPATAEALTVDWQTRDGTAKSDLSVKTLARDDLGNPFITVIESLDSTVRTYIDGCFPKWYAASFHDRANTPKFMTTYLFTQNLINWLSRTKTGGQVLLLGDKLDSPYNVKNPNANDFFPVFDAASSATGRTLVVEYVYDVVPSKTYFDSFDCIIYIGSHYTGDQVNTPEFISALVESHLGGIGFAAISDHGVEDITGTGFFKGVNEILIAAFGVGLKGSVDRGSMVLTVENAKLNQGDHPLWAGLSGQIDSGASEAYVDAIDSEPDYVSGRGTLNFAVGEQHKIIEVTIVGDTVIENDEYFEIMISNNSRGQIVKNVGRVTLQDDDAEPCGVTTGSGGAGITETIHNMGSESGQVVVAFDMFGVPDMMEIFYDGVRVAATSRDLSNPYPTGTGRYYNLPNGNKDLPTEVSGAGTLSFYYEGPPNKPSTMMVRMTGPDGTAWNYDLGCPIPMEAPPPPAVTIAGIRFRNLDPAPGSGAIALGYISFIKSDGQPYDFGAVIQDNYVNCTFENGYCEGQPVQYQNSYKPRQAINGYQEGQQCSHKDYYGPFTNDAYLLIRLSQMTDIISFDIMDWHYCNSNGGPVFRAPALPYHIDLLDASDNVICTQVVTSYVSPAADTKGNVPIQFPCDPVIGGTSTGGGGADCFAFGTLITMLDGFEKEIEDVVVGEQVKTFAIEGLTDASAEVPVDYLTWSTYDLQIKESSAVVTSVSYHETNIHHKIWIEGKINPIMVTAEHPFLVKYSDRNDWIFDYARYLKTGDTVLNAKGQQVKVLANQLVYGNIKTVRLDVETLDTYFAGGILVHNKDTTIQQ